MRGCQVAVAQWNHSPLAHRANLLALEAVRAAGCDLHLGNPYRHFSIALVHREQEQPPAGFSITSPGKCIES